MSELKGTPSTATDPNEIAFRLGVLSGSATAVELIRTFGYTRAEETVDRDVETALSDYELEIMYAAVQLVIAARLNAPDDTSTLPPVEPDSCHRSDCRICTDGTRSR